MKLADRVARLEQAFTYILQASVDNKQIIRCPDCQSTKVHKDGNYIKGGKRYACLNKQCNRYFIIKQ